MDKTYRTAKAALRQHCICCVMCALPDVLTFLVMRVRTPVTDRHTGRQTYKVHREAYLMKCTCMSAPYVHSLHAHCFVLQMSAISSTVVSSVSSCPDCISRPIRHVTPIAHDSGCLSLLPANGLKHSLSAGLHAVLPNAGIQGRISRLVPHE